jgi:hypothetical protein
MDPENADAAESRPPTLADLLLLCRSLNTQGARYMVVGGFAVNHHGYPRTTMDIDLLVDSTLENQSKVKKSLEVLPDKAVLEIANDDLNDYVVIRVGDEVTVDLMAAACGVTYEDAARDVEVVTIEDVPIPFVSAETLLRMKQTYRSKDEGDRLYLQRLLAERHKSQK